MIWAPSHIKKFAQRYYAKAFWLDVATSHVTYFNQFSSAWCNYAKICSWHRLLQIYLFLHLPIFRYHLAWTLRKKDLPRSSVTRLGDFRKFLVRNYLSKLGLLGYFKYITFKFKLLGNFWGKLGYLLVKHPVTLFLLKLDFLDSRSSDRRESKKSSI